MGCGPLSDISRIHDRQRRPCIDGRAAFHTPSGLRPPSHSWRRRSARNQPAKLFSKCHILRTIDFGEAILRDRDGGSSDLGVEWFSARGRAAHRLRSDARDQALSGGGTPSFDGGWGWTAPTAPSRRRATGAEKRLRCSRACARARASHSGGQRGDDGYMLRQVAEPDCVIVEGRSRGVRVHCRPALPAAFEGLGEAEASRSSIFRRSR